MLNGNHIESVTQALYQWSMAIVLSDRNRACRFDNILYKIIDTFSKYV